MASITANELQQFYQFIGDQLDGTAADMSPEDCLDLWRIQNPSPEEIADSVAAIRTALGEAQRGEGRPAHEILAELRAELQLPAIEDVR